jgi:4-hydroxybenzoate polyprenyltransferase
VSVLAGAAPRPRLVPWLRLLRAGTLFSPAGDVIAGLCVVAAATAVPVWSWDAVRAVLASVAIYGAGMVLNDVADRGEDARLRPERPIPRGDVAVGTAAVAGALLLGLALLVSPPPCRGHHAVLALLVVAYDFALKRSVLAGAATMGVLRAGNLATAGAPLWPYWPSALLAAALCYGVYIAAVTILGHFEDRPPARARAVVALQTAPLVAGCVGLLAVQGGPWPAPALALLPIVLFARRNRTTAVWDAAAIRRSMTLLLLGTMLYTALLAAACERYIEALSIAGCIPAARAVTRALRLPTMT